ncbi:MAG: hypothetical protein JRN68_02210 [Nitrososphaerota archaeon]|jgi:hypothetical protein|nr:hypothetical protein [Nitrososphaerota archaeon]
MKVAAVVDARLDLKPLDQGERIILLSDEGTVQKIEPNPGYGFTHGGKEQAMEVILAMGADAVAVREQFLCPCTYNMSKGKLLYIHVSETNLEGLKSEYSKLAERAANDVDPSVYYEDPHAHDSPHVGHTSTNASFSV